MLTTSSTLPIHSAQGLYGAVIDDRFTIGARIGEGRTGEVFEVEVFPQPSSAYPPLVLKTLKPEFAQNQEYQWRLMQEAWVGIHVRSPGVAKVYAFGKDAQGPSALRLGHDRGTCGLDASPCFPYIVMQRVFGESLLSYHWRQPLDWPTAIHLTRRLVEILLPVHASGVVHRDIKPEHIYLERTREGLQVHLIDFGVCASPYANAQARQRERGRVYGTPTYSSPEQAMGEPEVDSRADVFAVGVVLFELITGRVPWTGNRAEVVLQKIASEDAPRAGLIAQDLPRSVDALVAKCLRRNKAQRFQSSVELHETLLQLEHNFRLDTQTLAHRVGCRVRSDHSPNHVGHVGWDEPDALQPTHTSDARSTLVEVVA